MDGQAASLYGDQNHQITADVRNCNFSSDVTASAKDRERTFMMVKPDGVQRNLIGQVIKRFERKGFKLVAMKFLWPSEELVRQHYSHLSDEDFFPRLVRYMTSGPVVAMVWEGKNAVSSGRLILGKTDPYKSDPGTIRGDFGFDVSRFHFHMGVCHGSDSLESAKKEISLWFREDELVYWTSCTENWLYEYSHH